MAAPVCDDRTFIELFETIGPHRTHEKLKTTLRNVYARRERIERRLGRVLLTPTQQVIKVEHPGRILLDVPDGEVIVGGDAHIWPGPMSTAMRAFIKFCKDRKPRAVIMNGDAFDGARISRHAPIGWENRPTVIEELEAVQEQLGEVAKAAFKARKLWPLGNHDGRFETKLAQVAPEFAKVKGFHLKDHMPDWEACWSVWINDSVVVKHRGPKGGVHATHNNVIAAGKSIVTNHLHSGKVTPYNHYGIDTLWGVDTGCLADPHGPQFLDYTEDNPRNHRSGFALLTFIGGKLMQPELILVWNENTVQFRGKLIEV